MIAQAAPVGPGEVWGAWVGDPLAAFTLLVLAWVYARGVGSIWRQVGRHHVVTRGQAVRFWLGIGALALALVSPAEALAHTLLTGHMIQHLLLGLVAAPLLASARPVLALLQGLPHRVRRPAARLHVRAQRLRVLTRAGWWPLAVVIVYGVGYWIWHLPGPYQAALSSDLVHVAEHATILATSIVLWWTVLSSGARHALGYGSGIAVLFAAALIHAGLGAVLVLSPGHWYTVYESGAALWGTTALSDQQMAGVLMWAPSKLIHGVAVVALVLAWLRDVDARSTAREQAPPVA